MSCDALSLLHIEDDPVWTATVARLLVSRREVTYLGACPSAEAAVRWCETLRPTVVLASARARRDSGLAALARLRERPVPPAVALLTDRTDDLLLFHARREWIAGVVTKANFSAEELDRLLEHVAQRRRYFSPGVRVAMSAFTASPHAFFKILSNVELALLPRFACGESDAEIARTAGASPLTIKSHRNRIMMKLDVHKAEKLMRWCLEKGFVELP